MGIIYRKYNSQIGKFNNVEKEDMNFGRITGAELMLSIDGSSSRTGMSIIDYATNSLYGTMAVERDAKEDYVEYKIRLKRAIKDFMDTHLNNLKRIFYEEPFVGFTVATEVLMAIRTTVKEIKIENAPKYDGITFTEVNNQKWKKIFLSPIKVPAGSDAQKLAVQQKVASIFGKMATYEVMDKKQGKMVEKLIFTEDECDSIGLGIACLRTLKAGYDDAELITKKKAKPFKYNIEYLVSTAESPEEAEELVFAAFGEYCDKWKIPNKVVDNGINSVELNGRGAFDKHVFDNMGSDDKLLLLTFQGGKYVDAIIGNGRSDLCREYSKDEFITAFVWRKTRK